MAGELGHTTANLEKDLLENGAAYDYFQAVRLIGLLGKQTGADGELNQDHKLKIRPELSFNYPASDIAEIRYLEGEAGFSITTTFMGLYGVSSPLPAFFTEELLDDEWEEATAPRGFLDIIHQHLYPLLYRAWLKYVFSHNAVENGDETYWDILYSLMGLGTEDIKASIPQRKMLVRYAGLLAQQHKTAAGLQAILQDFLSPLSVEIEPCVMRMVNIPDSQKTRIGERQCRLGDSAILGERVLDRTGKVRVRIGPVCLEQYEHLMADRTKMDFVRFIMRFHMMQPLDFEIALSLAPETAEGVSLGGGMWSRLGVDAWLYSHKNPEIIDVVVA